MNTDDILLAHIVLRYADKLRPLGEQVYWTNSIRPLLERDARTSAFALALLALGLHSVQSVILVCEDVVKTAAQV